MDKFYIIAPVSALSRRLRLYKLVGYISDQYPNCKIKHIGWERNLGESEEKQLLGIKIEKKILLTGGGYGGGKVKLMYFLWMIKVFFYSFFIPSKSKVWALGFETAFPLLLMSKVKKFDIYFDDADRFSMVFKFPKPIKIIIQKFEIFTSRNVYKHIVPSLSRYDFQSENFFVLKNLPSKKELLAAQQIYKNKEWPKAKLVIYVNGWLGRDRGMDVALNISESFNKEDLIILLAGRIDCEEAELLSHRENVVYLGNISNAEALAAYYASDYVLTYFNPSIEINRLAESNKWGDALATGCGVLVNNEVTTFSNYNFNNLKIDSFSYFEVNELIFKLKDIGFNPKNKIILEQSKSENTFEKYLGKII